MHILLLDDGLSKGAGLQALLQRQGHRVRWMPARAVPTAVDLAGVDVLLMDTDPRPGDALARLRQVRAIDGEVAIVLASSRDLARMDAVAAGASEYLLLPVGIDVLVDCLERTVRRARRASAPILINGPLTLDCGAYRCWLNDEAMPLTLSEWRVLEILLRHTGGVVSKQRIDALLANEDRRYNAAEVFVSKLRHKLAPGGITIRTVRGLGYLLDDWVPPPAHGTQGASVPG